MPNPAKMDSLSTGNELGKPTKKERQTVKKTANELTPMANFYSLATRDQGVGNSLPVLACGRVAFFVRSLCPDQRSNVIKTSVWETRDFPESSSPTGPV